MASRILMFSIIILININEFIPQNSNYLLLIILNSAILIKIGAAPFHIWFPEVIEGLNWNNCIILLTWQKLAPIILIIYNNNIIVFISIIIIFSTITGRILGLNQIRLRKILAYSSINHIGWILSRIFRSQTIWIIYFIVYSIINLNITLIFKKINIFQTRQLISSLNSNKIRKFIFIINFWSLGGIPPFLGFFPKWITLNFLIQNNFFVIRLILVLTALITLFFYLRITFSIIVINSEETLINKKKNNFYSIYIFNTISLIRLIICPLIFSFY